MKKLIISLSVLTSLGIYSTINTNKVSAKPVTIISNNSKTKVSVEYQNALYTAKEYLENSAMSQKGLYSQLTSSYGSGFKSSAAKYAIRQLNSKYHINWNKIALRSAKEYQSVQHMSKSDIYHQLVSDYGEQFTESQAKYAVNHLPG